MFDLRLLTGVLATLLVLILAGVQLLGGNADVAALARGEAPRIELSVMEKPLPGASRDNAQRSVIGDALA